MDGSRKPTSSYEQPASKPLNVWRPQSRIAGYINGKVKLEELVSHEKLVKPEDRHNKRAFLTAVQDDDDDDYGRNNQLNCAPPIKPKPGKCETHASAVSRCPSTSTRTSASLSLSRRRHLTVDDLTRTIVEKNEHITTLREQLDALRNCVRVERLLQEDRTAKVTSPPPTAALDRMLECLLAVSTQLKRHDEHDERMAQFAAAVRRERESMVRGVDALHRSNAHKEDKLRLMSGEQTALQDQLRQLREDTQRLCATNEDGRKKLELVSSDAKNVRIANNQLQQRLCLYKEYYQKAADELRNLSEFSEQLLTSSAADRQTFDAQMARSKNEVQEHQANIAKLQTQVQQLNECKLQSDAKLANLEKDCAMKERLKAEMVQLRDQVSQLSAAKKKLREKNAQLQAENTQLQKQLIEAQVDRKDINDQVRLLKKEKDILEQSIADELAGEKRKFEEQKEIQDTHKECQDALSTISPDLSQRESHWHELKQRFFKAVQQSGIIQADDVR